MDVRIERAEQQIGSCSAGQRAGLEHRPELAFVPFSPRARVEAQQTARRIRSGSIGHVHPFSTSGGITPGIPSATGRGPRVSLVWSTNSTPSLSIRVPNRSMLRAAGP